MKRVLLVAALLGLLSTLPAGAYAASGHHSRVHAASLPVTFHLHVSGHAPAGTTFWVSYGPLADRWGTLRLSGGSDGVYTASADLPARVRSTFAFIAAEGRVRTPAGWAPGGSIVTIRLLESVTAAQASANTVEWQAPVG